MSHIPPGNSDCWSVFSREFVKIVERFESTVVAQFYGHTHNEEFKITYSADSSPLTNTSDDSNTTVITQRPINIAFMAGSLTTYADLNPSYRVYTIDGPRKNSSWVYLFFPLKLWIKLNLNCLGCARFLHLGHELDRSELDRADGRSGLVQIIRSKRRVRTSGFERQISR